MLVSNSSVNSSQPLTAALRGLRLLPLSVYRSKFLITMLLMPSIWTPSAESYSTRLILSQQLQTCLLQL